MSQLRPTHRLTAKRFGRVECAGDGDCPEGATCEDGVCVDGYGQPVEDTQVVVEDRHVRYHANGTELTRSEGGQDVINNPAIEGNRELVNDLEAGDSVTLEAITDGYDDYENLEVTGDPIPVYGRRSRPTKTNVELETA